MYVQKAGICIGSCVVLVLCIYIPSKEDGTIDNELDGMNLKVFIFVNDYLVLVKICPGNGTLIDVMKAFKKKGFCLEYTFKVPKQHEIVFEYLHFLLLHTSWMHHPRSTKDLLSYTSAHSKIVKNGMAISCIGPALKTSCEHLVEQSVAAQVDRLRGAGYPEQCVILACERNRPEVKAGSKAQSTEKEAECGAEKVAVIPYLHVTSHRLKKVASRHEVCVLLSATNKLAKMCPVVQRVAQKRKEQARRCVV